MTNPVVLVSVANHFRTFEYLPWPRLTPLQWALGNDTGISSCTLIRVQFGLEADKKWGPDIPHDAGDFGRCYRLIKSVEGMTNPVEAAANAYPFWRPMADAWLELTVLYEDMLRASMQAEPEFDPREPVTFNIRRLEKDPTVVAKGTAFSTKIGMVVDECRALKIKLAQELAEQTTTPDEGPTP
jgi:hypothetical protein